MKSLIRTKLNRPSAGQGLVERSRLLSRLDECLNRRVTLISAPPGFGKTTLAVQWLERRGRRARSAWISLDRYDSDPERFARYLVAALQDACPGCFPATARLLSAGTPPPWEHFAEVVASEVAMIDRPLVLVLDDYQAVASEKVQQLVLRMVEGLPESVRLLVLTRVDPPWPLARWRSRLLLGELRGRDLRFSAEEAHAFFALDGNVPLSGETVDLLLRRTEGWIVGLRLAQISLGESEHPEERARKFSGSDRLIADYLMEEVLAVQPPEIRRFFAVTAPLDRFCAALCDHLLADQDSQPESSATIARLVRENLFLIPLDTEGRWYRYHHLFQKLLVDHLKETSAAGTRTSVARRAAEWLAREGLVEEALQYWIAAGDLDSAANLLGENLLRVVDEDLSRQTLTRWLRFFPPEAERTRLPLLVAHTCVNIFRWDLAGMARMLDQAERLLRDSTRRRTNIETRAFGPLLDAQRAFLNYWQGDAAGALSRSSRALATLPPGGGGIFRSTALLYKAGGLAMTGRQKESLRFLDDATKEDTAAGSRRAGELITAQAAVYLYAMEIDTVDRLALRILEVHKTVTIPDYWLGHAYLFRGLVAYERNHLEEAAQHFRRVETLRYLIPSRVYQDALIGLALIALAKDDRAGADSYAAAARAFALEAADPMSIRVADSFEARLALEVEGAAPAELAPPTMPDHMFFWLEVPSLTYAACLLRRPSTDASRTALPFIEQALERVERCQNALQAIRFSLLRALALDGKGRRDAALECLKQTLQRAEPHGLVRTFLDRGPRLCELLEAAAQRYGCGGYLASLLTAFGQGRTRLDRGLETGFTLRFSAAARGRNGSARQDLTNRELDVLELLADRFSNKEIASRLSVSNETVKAHVRTIYDKLGVHDRREATAVAHARGLLPPGAQ